MSLSKGVGGEPFKKARRSRNRKDLVSFLVCFNVKFKLGSVRVEWRGPGVGLGQLEWGLFKLQFVESGLHS